MHWTEELAQWLEKKMGQVVMVFVITVLASVSLGLLIGWLVL